MDKNKKYIADQIDSMPIDQARLKIASGFFGDIGSPSHAFAFSWLSAKEANLRDAKEAKIKSLDKASISFSSTSTWHEIEREYDISKRSFGKRINFIRDQFKRKIIFRDLEQAYLLAHYGFHKPSVVLAGSVIEELLRLYLVHKKVTPTKNNLDSYIKACDENDLLKAAIHRLADSVRQFRNTVHLEKETTSRHTISKSTAIGAVASIFTIANDFKEAPNLGFQRIAGGSR
ncbi:MAG: hypothetical protein KJ663_03525 [Proteobacteria bacterium]|nr:hypothetical protein [Pseudomonadota bacterium]